MLRVEVSFLIIGAAKCATTWLQRSLQACDGIEMPNPELHFFSRDYGRGLAWYEAQFAGLDHPALLGEKSNSYLSDPAAPGRIRAALPRARLVAQLRDPVKRAYSDYCMLFRRGEVSADIGTWLDPRRSAEHRFIADGCYARSLERFHEHFPEEQMLVLFYEDIKCAPEGVLARLGEHIGHCGAVLKPVETRVKNKDTPVVPLHLRRVLRPFRPALDRVRDTALVDGLRRRVARPVQYPPLTEDLAARLRDYFEPENARLERLIGRKTPGWGNLPAPEVLRA